MPNLGPSRPPLSRNVKLLGWTSLLNDVASEAVFPLLPDFLQTLGAPKSFVGLIEGMADAVASVLKLQAGAWSDRLRARRGFVMVGYGLTACLRPLFALATAPWHVLAVRLADRVGKGLRTSPRDALLAESTAPSDRGRAFGFHRAMDHLGAAIGPALAFAFLQFFPRQWRWVFALTIVPGALAMLLLWFGLRDTPREELSDSADKRTPGSPPKLSLSLRPLGNALRRYLAVLVLFTLGNSSDLFLLTRARELGIPSGTLPLLWLAFHLLKSVGSPLGGRLVDAHGARRTLTVGWSFYTLAYVGFALAASAWHAWTLFGLYSVFYALAEPAEKALVAELAPSHQHGLAFGWFHLAVGLTALPANLLFGACYDVLGPTAAFAWGAALAGGAMLALARFVPPRDAWKSHPS